MDMINISKIQEKNLTRLCSNIKRIVDLKKTNDDPEKELLNFLLHLTANGEGVVVPENFGINDMDVDVMEKIAIYIDSITEIAISVFMYNNIDNIQLQEKFNKYVLEMKNYWFCLNNHDNKVTICSKKNYVDHMDLGDKSEYASLDFLNSLGPDLSKNITELLTKLYVPIPEIKISDDSLNDFFIDKDSDLTDYDGNLGKSSKEVVQSFAKIIKNIFEIFKLNNFVYKEVEKTLSFKIGNDSMAFVLNDKDIWELKSLVTEKKFVNVQDVKEMVEKIDFASPKKDDQNPSNKFKNNNPGSSNDSSNSDPQGGKKQFGTGTVVLTGFGCLAAGVTSTYFFTSTKNDRDSDKNQNLSMDNYPKYEESFDKLQTGPAAA
jgi:hypothetical protein